MQSSYLKQSFLYEINTRTFCLENHCTLETLPNWFFETPEFLAADMIWFMGIWKPSPRSREICMTHEGLKHEFQKALPDLQDIDIIGSPYAVYEYTPNPLVLKSWTGLKRLKTKLNRLGKKLILDFVPNHMAVDTPYLNQYPELFLHKADHETVCRNSFLNPANGKIYYHGRDPYFDGWTDTVQWDFSRPEVLELHKRILTQIAEYCDGLRCDMAMLPQPDVFEKTHGKKALPYWKPLLEHIREQQNSFIFLAEVYWGREYELQQVGFDYTYDKTLYDRLKTNDFHSLKAHLEAEEEFQNKSLRFIENHDEERAYSTFGKVSLSYFSLLCFLSGSILYYEGQSEGRKIKLPVQLGRVPQENLPKEVQEFYHRAFKQISERELEKETFELKFFGYEFIESPVIVKGIYYFKKTKVLSGRVKVLNIEFLILNFSEHIVSGWLRFDDLINKFVQGVMPEKIQVRDIVSNDIYEKEKSEIMERGIYIKLSPKQAHWFVMDSDLLR